MSTLHLIRAYALGDVLWIEPVVRQLAARHDRVVVHTKYRDLFRGYPLPNVSFRGRISRPARVACDAAWALLPGVRVVDLDMSYELHPKMHILHAYQQAAGLPQTREYPRLPVPDVRFDGDRALPARFAVLHAHSPSERNYRAIHGVAWADVVRHLKSLGLETIQVGADPPAVPGARYVRTDLPELIALVSRATLFIGADSGPSHVAASLGTPCLLFFGAVNPEFRHFRELLRGTILQQPCEFAGCYHEVVSLTGPACRLVGDAGVPKCSLHRTQDVCRAVTALVEEVLPR